VSMPVPDLTEPVVGFRAWKVIEDRLFSPYIPCRWEGRVMHAECYPANRALLFGRGWLDAPHGSPDPRCRCGIYAYHRPGVQSFYGDFDWLPGIVTVWGRLEAHRDGLRAEHARVEALAVHPAWPARRRDAARAIADRLGTGVIAHDALREVAVAHGGPLPASLLPSAATG
jgi:hypothetical protein